MKITSITSGYVHLLVTAPLSRYLIVLLSLPQSEKTIDLMMGGEGEKLWLS